MCCATVRVRVRVLGDSLLISSLSTSSRRSSPHLSLKPRGLQESPGLEAFLLEQLGLDLHFYDYCSLLALRRSFLSPSALGSHLASGDESPARLNIENPMPTSVGSKSFPPLKCSSSSPMRSRPCSDNPPLALLDSF